MLKHLYKTLLISVISGSLLSFNPAVALADGETRTTTDNNGVITAKKNYKFEKVSDADMITSITMLAGGYITARMLRFYRPATPDVLIAAAGGAAYVAGEVITNVKFKGKIDEMTIEIEKKNDGTVNEEQVKRLEDLKASYEEAKKTTNIKKILQLASATAFGAAGIYATYLAVTEDSTAVNCRAAIATSTAELNTCVAAGAAASATGVAAKEAAECKICQGILLEYNGTYNAYVASRSTPKFSFSSDKAVSNLQHKLTAPGATCDALTGVATGTVSTTMKACSSSVKVLMGNETNADSPAKKVNGTLQSIKKYLNLPVYTNISEPHVDNQIKGLSSYIEKGLDFLFPKAQASWIPLLGFSASAAAAFFLISASSLTAVDRLMFVPRNRAIAWGLLAGLALMAAKSSDGIMAKLDGNIAKIDSILADLNKLSKGVKAQNLTQQGIGISTINPGAISPVSFSTDSKTTTDCMVGNNSTNCPKLSNQLSSMPGFSNLPDSFKDIASQSVALGDSLSGSTGITGSTLSSAASLGAKQNAVSKLLKSRESILDKRNPKTTMLKEQEKLQKSLAASIKKALEQKGMNATGFMASIGSSPIDSSIKLPKDDDLLKTKAIVTGGAGVSGSGASDDGANSLKLDFNEQAPADTLSMGEVNATGAAPEYDIKSPDINGEFGPSLFELISGRYIKSGYPKLLEEEPAKN